MAPGGGSLIVHHNAPYMAHALWALGRARVRGRRIIGYWAWELPRLPRSGAEFPLRARNLGAEHASPATPSPPRPTCRCMWCRIRCRQWPATPNMRGRLGLPADALVVLTVFHLGSAFARKNPLAAIAAFRKAFGDAPNRVLVIKLIDNGAQWRAARTRRGDRRRRQYSR